MSYRLNVCCKHETNHHPIFIGTGLAFSTSFADYCVSLKRPLVIVTDTNLVELYGQSLKDLLSARGLQVHLFSFPAGEEYKTRQTKEEIENHLFSHRMGKDTALIALGGGVVTDLAGFVAATYCRGMSLIMLPTSLLAMVDASIGGKNGVNVPAGKNMVGTIYQPHALFIDPSFLRSLPPNEIKNGMAEIIKHGIIASSNNFYFLEEQAMALLKGEAAVLERAIYESCCIKQKIVEEDEHENGKRRLLNFGHTIGHALENVSHYQIAHGKAVAIGIMVESYLSVQLGYLSTSSFDRIMALLNTYQIDLKVDQVLTPSSLLHAMAMDKKAAANAPRFVLLQEIGEPLSFDGAFCSQVSEPVLLNTLEWLCHERIQRS